MNEVDNFTDVLKQAQKDHKRVSILVAGSYKPFTGFVKSVNIFQTQLENEYSVEYIRNVEIKAVRIYE